MTYVGRFAPSPTGPLHEGSLLTAVASFLHARRAGGEWLVRIEDIDPPREVPGAADDILRSLETLELTWDRPVLYQSRRLEVYLRTARQLVDAGLAYCCRCSRKMLRGDPRPDGVPAGYPGTCRSRGYSDQDAAIRMRVDVDWEAFDDGLQGRVVPAAVSGFADYVIRRRDRLPAYHLAVVVDDAHQGVTTIVRGADLLDCVPAQRHLQRALALPEPAYFHLPIVTTATGEKLSKQTGARRVDLTDPSEVATRILSRLGAAPPRDLLGAPPGALWEWAKETWRIDGLRGVSSLPEDG